MWLSSVRALIVSAGTCLLVGAGSAVVTVTSVKEWYPRIQKPAWAPPDAVFGPVWTALFLLMGVSAWLVWRDSAGSARRRAIGIFSLQLVLNGAWSFIFFGLHRPGWAALEIVVLWSAIVATLLVPYLMWVSFAAALNMPICRANR